MRWSGSRWSITTVAETVNRTIADSLTARQLRVGRAESQERRAVWAILALLEADILDALKVADPTEFVLLTRRRREVDALMVDVEALITTRYEAIADETTDWLVRLAQQEAGVVQDIVNEATSDETIEAMPSARELRAVVTQTLIPTPTTPTDLSATGEEWWQRQGASLTLRLRDSLRQGVTQEERLTHLAQRVRGTSDQGFRDGLMERARQDASRLLTTEVSNATSEAHAAVARVNAEAVLLEHTSVLDSGTTLVCIARHGARYRADTHAPVGHSLPYLNGVPYHIG
jgi:hypothetical protein